MEFYKSQYELKSFKRIFEDCPNTLEIETNKINKYFPDIWKKYIENVKLYRHSCVSKFYPKVALLHEIDAANTMINFELTDLLIERYSLDYSNPNYKKKLKKSPHYALVNKLKNLKNTYNISIVNLTWDINFETVSIDNKLDIIFQMDLDCPCSFNNSSIPIIKPHGGFNMFHDSSESKIFPEKDIKKAFTVEKFRYDFSDLYEPLIIGYLGNPDVFTQEHNKIFTEVGDYFEKQKEIFNNLLQNATHLLAIGYCFPRADKHLYEIKENDDKEEIEKHMITKFKNIKKMVMIDSKETEEEKNNFYNNLTKVITEQHYFAKNDIIFDGYNDDSITKAFNRLGN